MSMTQQLPPLKDETLQQQFAALNAFVRSAAREGTPIHEAERGIWQRLLKLGRLALGQFLDLQGSGDQGEALVLPDGHTCQRLPQLHRRRYVSIFGEFLLQRTAYGSREGQRVEFVPLDNRLQLPTSAFSYLLQDWDQALCAEQAFGQASAAIARILGLEQSVDSLEGMNRQMAAEVGWFRDLQPAPPPAEEGQVVVVTADCKGVVIRGQGTKAVCGGQRPGGTRANQKQMATVGAVYTVDRYVRTPAAVVAALFRDPGHEPGPRPVPCHKHVWGSLAEAGPQPRSSIAVTFDWLTWEYAQRNPRLERPAVYLCDGQEALWQACDDLPQANAVQVLDLLHVTPRLWQAAKLLYGERGAEVVPFVRRRVLQILEGQVDGVLRALPRLAAARGLRGAKTKALARIGAYLRKNRHRMRYDAYLAAGYPIASGVIEGACRHLVKDRMERAGMHWTVEGAQAMLDLRSVYIAGQWQTYQAYWVEAETERLYPHRRLVAGEAFFALAA